MSEQTKSARGRAGSKRAPGSAAGNGARAAGPRGEDNGDSPAFGSVTTEPRHVPRRPTLVPGGSVLIHDDRGQPIGPWPDGRPAPPLDPKLAAAWTPKQLLQVYRFMRKAREIENHVINLYRQGRISGGVYVGRGNEATAVAGLYCLRPDDPVTILHRDMAAHLVRGWTTRQIFMQYFARRDAPNFGKDTGLHLGSLENFSLATVSPLGCMIPVTLGAAIGLKMQGKDAVGLTFTGDGASSLGDFHEALNFAGVWKAPFVLIVENNQFAYSTPTGRQFACARISDRAVGYGMPGTTIDGTDVLQMLAAVRTAVDRARSGEGPTLIESVTMRMRGHSEHDISSYCPPEMVQSWATWDPLQRFEEFMTGQGILTEAELASTIEEIKVAIDDGVEFALSQPSPEGPEAAEGVYA